MRSTQHPLLLIACLVALATPAFASDGVLEINQTCALDTGCFVGDVPGFPVTITQAGSYRLTGNLTVSSADSTAILVQASATTVDLGGFTIRGVTACSGTGATLTCAPLGIGEGLDVSSGVIGVTVRNGSVIGMGSRGVVVGQESTVSGIRAEQNGSNGIVVSNLGLVTDSHAHRNASNGIQTGTAVQVRSCSAQQNRSSGIDAGARAVVVGNTASGNGFMGLNVFSGLVQGNTSGSNAFDGIQAQSPTLILDNVAISNTDDGITCLSGCRIHGNISRGNGDFGLQMNSTSAYSSNVVTSNTTGGVNGGANRGSNFCDGNGVVSSFCP